MKYYQYKLSTGFPILIIPRIEVVHDGHPIMVHHYDLYRDRPGQSPDERIDPDVLSSDKWTDPDYLGELTIELPGKLFTYHHEDRSELSTEEMQEVIAYVMDLRSISAYGSEQEDDLGSDRAN